ncbi:MAG: hypothetical protein COT81_03515 [Candidatus Buchananbacteria bacterium CG10_big_fil_rev_8_21_14_0_10_42_9]|uniref:HD domain-containing protein n=1 Tax=Candidatus Buchananbacteria bacterium CG10_big_fil_rev_8_21_14_0_10_42_9 TaxID=1974526 RepID=A0A2H0W0W8_9BACT|nr:MAG: hypothetical protein COT81_03515 [Candidatus Buchananbacteria bacterium CG10_big_fil_rev_8_21_14_0_10_42_9]
MALNFSKITKAKEFAFIKDFQKHFPQSEVFLVGGAVRDILLRRETKDFDFVIRRVSGKELEMFLKNHGTVTLAGKHFGVLKFRPKGYGGEEIDIALPRTEHSFGTGKYHDFDITADPHLPIEKDLERRDFTINAMALSDKNVLIDPFDGAKDLKAKIIKTVGTPKARFEEDYTRMLRAVRIATQLNFTLEPKTAAVITAHAKYITSMAAERIQDEFNKIIMSDNAGAGIRLMLKLGLLEVLVPELVEGDGVAQNKNHIYTVIEHNIRALETAARRKFNLAVRLAALFHDIGKPRTKKGTGVNATFYDHETVGAKMTKDILKRFKYSNELQDKVTHLVRQHMFYYALDQVSDAGVRRLLSRIGPENIEDLLKVRICDRIGMGRPKAVPYKLIEMQKRFREVQSDPISRKMLKLNGNDVMQILGISPSRRIAYLLDALLGEVLENPKKNTKRYLAKKLVELNKLSDEKLAALDPNVQALEEERKRALWSEPIDVES